MSILDDLGLFPKNVLLQDWDSVVKFIKQSEDGPDEEENLPNDLRELKNRLHKMKVLIKQQIEESRKLSAPPFLFGVVVAINNHTQKDPTAVIIQNGRLLEVYLPKDKKILPGATVKVSSQTMQIVDITQSYPFGEIGLVRNVISELTSEVNYSNGKRVVLNGELSGKIEAGDRVVLDTSANVILLNLGRAEQQFLFSQEAKITWDDIGGQEEAKEKLKEALELPYTEKDLFAHYNAKTPKGLLLIGPPGCGKTLLIEAAATSMSKTHSKEKASTGFMLINGAEILEKFVGVAEDTIEQIFLAGEEHFEKHNFPAIIAFDEADSILRKRGSGKSSDATDSLVTVFLTRMNRSRSIIILATNKPEILDEAVTRDKRINHIVEVGRPDKKAAISIAKIHLKDTPIAPGEGTTDEMVDYIASEMYSNEQVLYDITKANGQHLTFNLSHIINGAMIAGTVDDAISNAMKRDRKNKTKTGITKNDVKAAVLNKLKTQLLLDQTSNMAPFLKDFAEDFTNITQRQIQKN